MKTNLIPNSFIETEIYQQTLINKKALKTFIRLAQDKGMYKALAGGLV